MKLSPAPWRAVSRDHAGLLLPDVRDSAVQQLGGQARLLLDRAAPSALIYLRVEDARESARHLRGKGVQIETDPHRIHVDDQGVFGEPGWEEWMTFIRDSEGNLVGLASRHAPEA